MLIAISPGRIILESDPSAITHRVAIRGDDIPLGEQTVAQVSAHARRGHTCMDTWAFLRTGTWRGCVHVCEMHGQRAFLA